MRQVLKGVFYYLRALLAVSFYGYPARRMKVIGVTGTDGKTTTSTLIYHLLNKAGKKSALISTVGAYINQRKIDTGPHVTTPEPWLLQRIIRKALDKNCQYLVIETTSHGLDQKRVLGCNYLIGVLTNISPEHLDYHQSFEEYLLAKLKLFKKAKIAVLNKDDSSYGKVVQFVPKNKKIVTYSKKDLKGNIGREVKKRFPENYNRLNAVAAVKVLQLLKVKNSLIEKAIREFKGVEGRMENISNSLGIKIIVDFAHTPEALKKLLSYLRSKKKKDAKLIVVFGCAGERDRFKRPEMGRVAASLADISVFTSEDPRSEKVSLIIKEIEKGAEKIARKILKDEAVPKKEAVFLSIPDRSQAIYWAIRKTARKGDIVVVCGKGHEKTMNFQGTEYPWSDRKVIQKVIKGKVPSRLYYLE